jgi:hypothetical protein
LIASLSTGLSILATDLYLQSRSKRDLAAAVADAVAFDVAAALVLSAAHSLGS